MGFQQIIGSHKERGFSAGRAFDRARHTFDFSWPAPGRVATRNGDCAHQGTLIHSDQARQALAVSFAFDRIGDILNKRQHLRGDGGLHLGVFQVLPGCQRLHDVNHDRAGFGDHPLPSRRVLGNYLVRVFAGRQGRDADVGLQATFMAQQAAGVEGHLGFTIERLAGNLQSTQGGLIPGGVRIQGQHHTAGEALEQT